MKTEITVHYLLYSDGEVIFSNIPEEKNNEIFNKDFKYCSNGYEKEQKKQFDDGWIYILIKGENCTRKMFDKCLICYESIFHQIKNNRTEIQNTYNNKIKRFKHNIEFYVTKIQDELGDYSNTEHTGTKTYLENIGKKISEDPINASKIILRILKQVNSIKNEIEVYKKLNDEDSSNTIKLLKHNIRNRFRSENDHDHHFQEVRRGCADAVR